MLEQFRRHLQASGLIPEGARVLVGYSGGADSTCLLHLLHEAGVDIVAGHLHHGQRDEAEKELALCEAFCDELGIPFMSGRADVPLIAQEMKISLEEAGRQARYTFFKQACFRLDCHLIATAHTRTDNVETILLNLVRGTGLAGLGGIPEQRENIVRPLLIFSREQTRAYCDERGFWYHNDPANADVNFSRARIRHRVIPELLAINPAADATIARLGEIASEEDRFLNGMAAAALEQTEAPLNGDLGFLTRDCEAAFRRDAITTLPPVLFRRAMRLATEAVGGELTRHQTEAIREGVASSEKGSVTAEGGEVAIEWDAEVIHVRQVKPTAPFRYPLTLPGETASDEFGWQFQAFVAEAPTTPQPRASLTAYVSPRSVKGQLYFRTAAQGDEMRPLGFAGTRKMSDLLSEARLTLAARWRLPIVCDLVGPIWAPGVCLDDRVKVEEPGSESIALLFGPITGADGHNMETGHPR